MITTVAVIAVLVLVAASCAAFRFSDWLDERDYRGSGQAALDQVMWNEARQRHPSIAGRRRQELAAQASSEEGPR